MFPSYWELQSKVLKCRLGQFVYRRKFKCWCYIAQSATPVPTPEILVLRRLRQDHCKFEANLNSIEKPYHRKKTAVPLKCEVHVWWVLQALPFQRFYGARLGSREEEHCTYSSQWPSVRGFVHASRGKPEALVALWNAVWTAWFTSSPKTTHTILSLLKG